MPAAPAGAKPAEERRLRGVRSTPSLGRLHAFGGVLHLDMTTAGVRTTTMIAAATAAAHTAATSTIEVDSHPSQPATPLSSYDARNLGSSSVDVVHARTDTGKRARSSDHAQKPACKQGLGDDHEDCSRAEVLVEEPRRTARDTVKQDAQSHVVQTPPRKPRYPDTLWQSTSISARPHRDLQDTAGGTEENIEGYASLEQLLAKRGFRETRVETPDSVRVASMSRRQYGSFKQPAAAEEGQAVGDIVDVLPDMMTRTEQRPTLRSKLSFTNLVAAIWTAPPASSSPVPVSSASSSSSTHLRGANVHETEALAPQQDPRHTDKLRDDITVWARDTAISSDPPVLGLGIVLADESSQSHPAARAAQILVTQAGLGHRQTAVPTTTENNDASVHLRRKLQAALGDYPATEQSGPPVTLASTSDQTAATRPVAGSWYSSSIVTVISSILPASIVSPALSQSSFASTSSAAMTASTTATTCVSDGAKTQVEVKERDVESLEDQSSSSTNNLRRKRSEPQLLRKTASQHSLRQVASPVLSTEEATIRARRSSPPPLPTTHAAPLRGPSPASPGREASYSRKRAVDAHRTQSRPHEEDPLLVNAVEPDAASVGPLALAPRRQSGLGRSNSRSNAAVDEARENNHGPPARPKLRAKESLESILAKREQQQAAKRSQQQTPAGRQALGQLSSFHRNPLPGDTTSRHRAKAKREAAPAQPKSVSKLTQATRPESPGPNSPYISGTLKGIYDSVAGWMPYKDEAVEPRPRRHGRQRSRTAGESWYSSNSKLVLPTIIISDTSLEEIP